MEHLSSIAIWRKLLQQLDTYNQDGFQFIIIAAIGKLLSNEVQCHSKYLILQSTNMCQKVFLQTIMKCANVYLIHINTKTIIGRCFHQMKINNWNVNTKTLIEKCFLQMKINI